MSFRALGAMALVAAAACGGEGLAPRPLPLDHAHCARCDMIISSAANAAQVVSESEDPRFYDDIGCLASDRKARGAHARLYVRPRGGDGWLSLESAWFAHPSGLETPMGYGIAAYASEAAARAADRDGRALRWPDVVESEGESKP